MTYVRPNIYTNKQTSAIFNCVTLVSVSLTSLTRQLAVKLGSRSQILDQTVEHFVTVSSIFFHSRPVRYSNIGCLHELKWSHTEQ